MTGTMSGIVPGVTVAPLDKVTVAGIPPPGHRFATCCAGCLHQ